MNISVRLIFAVTTLLALAACGGSPAPEVALPAPSVPVKPPISGVVAASPGQKLDEVDREIAFEAQLAAVEKGQRQTWKGKKGAFGYVEAGAESTRAEGTCRDYTHKIYIAGRPQSAQGTACRAANGSWRFLS